MNRIIKFRAFDKKRNKLFDVDGIFNHPTNENIICVQGYDYEPNKIGWWNKEDLELMQFTGLHDKNGKEIYEGDVVTGYYHNLGVDYSKKGVVEMGWTYDSDGGANEKTYGGVSTHKDGDTSSLLDLVEYKNCEVIGNIYENPDLLNK